MGVKENLIAAKALIDTPDKWAAYPSIHRAVDLTAPDKDQREDALMALQCKLPREWPRKLFGFDVDRPHADVMALFDRAIAAADEVA